MLTRNAAVSELAESVGRAAATVRQVHDGLQTREARLACKAALCQSRNLMAESGKAERDTRVSNRFIASIHRRE